MKEWSRASVLTEEEGVRFQCSSKMLKLLRLEICKKICGIWKCNKSLFELISCSSAGKPRSSLGGHRPCPCLCG
ncbi:uncharacterized [Tachysurus ichikawai]